MDYGVITFTSTYGAIYAQKVLRPVADVLTMPVLREISLGLRHRRALPAGGRGGGARRPGRLRPAAGRVRLLRCYRLRGGPAGRAAGRVGAARRSEDPADEQGQGKGHDGGHEVFPAGGLVEQGLDEQHHARDAQQPGQQAMSSRKGRPTRNRMTGMRITAARQMMPSVNSVTMESVLLLMVPAYHTQIKAS